MRMLSEYWRHYNHARPHRGIGLAQAMPRPVRHRGQHHLPRHPRWAASTSTTGLR